MPPTTVWNVGDTLPREDIVRELIHLFYERVAPWAFIAIQLTDDRSELEQPWSVLVHAMVVVALRFLEDERVDPYKDRIHEAAKRYVMLQVMETTTIENLQALCLVWIDIVGSGKGPISWSPLALLTRSVTHLDLSRESLEGSTGMPRASGAATPSGSRSHSALSRTQVVPPPLTWREDETRRRLFWMCYVLDRHASLSTGWDFGILDFDVKRRLPAADDLWRQIVSTQAQKDETIAPILI